jgi:2,3-bisphosphoglycerate-independent phosphoglycerate mutase
MKKNKVVFIIKDGWGYRKEKSFNAIAEADTPFSDFLEKNYPTTILKASGEAVGLPKSYQGNSEVGHITIGTGRIIKEDLFVINEAIKNRSFFNNEQFLKAIKNCKKKNTYLHLVGLLQKKGVHSHSDHLYALLDLCKKEKFQSVFIHVITDGRDAPVKDSEKQIKSLREKVKKIGFGEIVTLSGRYYAMDRDNRWERTKKAYQAIANGISKEEFNDILKEIKKCYLKGETDEFIVPRVKEGYKGFKDGDSVIFHNFRSDRPRQLTQVIVEKDFTHWKREKVFVFFVAMTSYYHSLKNVAFGKRKEKNILGEIISKNKMKQLRISETEKYPHVTFFFNNQEEKPFQGETRLLVPSLKIPTYDLKPEMMAGVIAKKTVEEIKKDKYHFIVVNLVNADMVGHTAKKEAIIKAVEVVDKQANKIAKAGVQKGYTIFIFADHGNAEDQRPQWATSHTISPVKLTIVSKEKKRLKKSGGLQDVAPTALEVLEIKKPKEMTGSSLFLKN